MVRDFDWFKDREEEEPGLIQLPLNGDPDNRGKAIVLSKSLLERGTIAQPLAVTAIFRE